MGNVTIPLSLIIGVVMVLGGVIGLLWKELKGNNKTLLNMTVKFIESQNNSSKTIADLKKTIDELRKSIDGNTQTIRGITGSDLWKVLKAKEFLKGRPKKNEQDE